MIDRKKIVKGLECCFTDMDRSDSMPCRSCPYGTLPKRQNCQKVMFADILALLKEQEPLSIVYQENPYTKLPVAHCPRCGKCVNQFHASHYGEETHFCPYCGQEVKWDE